MLRNVPREAKIDPPIQTVLLRSGGAIVLTYNEKTFSARIGEQRNEFRRTIMLEGARAVSSFCMRSAMPGYMVVPPDRTTFL